MEEYIIYTLMSFNKSEEVKEVYDGLYESINLIEDNIKNLKKTVEEIGI